MRFADPARRPARESVVPMINVVFLLLVFLLLSATLSPAPPFEVALPEAEAETETGPGGPGAAVLHLAADGSLASGGLTGAALAALLPQLAGAAEVVLVTVPPAAPSGGPPEGPP